MLGDAYGLYYNKDMFEAGRHHRPAQDAVGVRGRRGQADQVRTGDSYSQLGFMPNYHGYETTTTHYVGQWDPTYFDADGKSTVATDPAFADMFEWQKQLVDNLGGYDKLEKYRTTFGDEFGAKNPFQTGQVAMAIDGEWRAGIVDDADVDFDYGVAPFPVPDDQADTYGKGYLSGTIIGIASTSEKQNAAWEFVKYLTTDTEAVVSFANAIHNVPSTIDGAQVTRPRPERASKTFIEIAQNPDSNTTPASPNGGAYQLTLQDLGYAYESGKETDLQGGLDDAADADRHRHRTGTSEHGVRRRRRPRSGGRRPLRAEGAGATAAQPRLPLAVADRHRLFFIYPLVSTVYFSFTHYDGFTRPVWTGLDNWRYVFRDYPFFWPALRNTLWLVVVMVDAAGDLRALRSDCWSRRSRPGAGALRTLFYLPYLAPPVAATMAFAFLLNPGTGPVNVILGKLGLPEPGWFNDPAWSKPALTLLALWGIGDLMVIFMAALLDVPTQQYEAAELDGAGAWQRFRYITLPNISPIVLFAVVTGVIQTMQYYTQPLVAGKVASGVIGGSGQQFEPGYPDEVDPDPAAARLQPRLPALRHRLGLRDRAGAVRAVDGVHRAAHAPWLRPAGSGDVMSGHCDRSPPDLDAPATHPSRADLAPAAAARRGRLEWIALHAVGDRARAAVPAAVRLHHADLGDERRADADPRPVAADLAVAQLRRRLAHARLRDLVAQHDRVRRGRHRADHACRACRSPTPWPGSGSAAATWRWASSSRR